MKITTLYVYPIKGLRGIKLQKAKFGPQGIEHDRTFMLFRINEDGTKKKLQLSSYPQCSLFEQRIVGDAIEVRYHTPAERLVPARSEQLASLEVPLYPELSELSRFDVDLYGSKASAYALGEPYDAWFTACFGFDTKLVYIGDEQRPIMGPSFHPRLQKQPQQQSGSWFSSITSYIPGYGADAASAKPEPWITFSDVAPYLITSESSLVEVSARLPKETPMPMYKFRPNIVLDGEGEDAWAEDYWAELVIGSGTGEHRMMLTVNCGRCTSLNVDYETGRPAEGEMGTVLKKLMKDRRVDPGVKWSPVFGRYAFLVDDEDEGRGDALVEVSVGDEVQVTKRNEARTVWDWPL